MAKNALERLFEEASNNSNLDKSQYSIDEQLDIEEDEFIDAMSDASKAAFLSKVQKVELEEPNIEEDLKMEEEAKTRMEDFLNDDIEDEEDSEDLLDDVSEEEDEEKLNEELEVPEEPKRGRGRPRKYPIQDTEQSTKEEQPVEEKVVIKEEKQSINSMSAFMDSLAKDVIEDLKKSDYKTRNYSKEQMLVILNYILEKI